LIRSSGTGSGFTRRIARIVLITSKMSGMASSSIGLIELLGALE
jgi:hypothetical protein